LISLAVSSIATISLGLLTNDSFFKGHIHQVSTTSLAAQALCLFQSSLRVGNAISSAVSLTDSTAHLSRAHAFLAAAFHISSAASFATFFVAVAHHLNNKSSQILTTPSKDSTALLIHSEEFLNLLYDSTHHCKASKALCHISVLTKSCTVFFHGSHAALNHDTTASPIKSFTHHATSQRTLIQDSTGLILHCGISDTVLIISPHLSDNLSQVLSRNHLGFSPVVKSIH
jgi:hypothetical protein